MLAGFDAFFTMPGGSEDVALKTPTCSAHLRVDGIDQCYTHDGQGKQEPAARFVS